MDTRLVDEANSNDLSLYQGLQRRKDQFYNGAAKLHQNLPGLRKVPLSAILIIALLIVVNIGVWVAVGIVLAYHPALAGTAALAYTFGLRHALDADHISAIDLMTRRLIASGQRPVTVGTFFSLGHSTIVIITSIVVAATSAVVRDRFNSFSHIGGIIGTSVSAAFLIILSCLNIYVLHKLIVEMRRHLEGAATGPQTLTVGGGFLFGVFKKLFRLVDTPWKMYPLGVLFGLGFDTSSEIALLGIASIQGAAGTSLWLILIYPLLFTAGMCMIDTADGALMMSLYTSTALARDSIAILYYSIVLTVLTIFIAAVIGVIQLLSLILNVTDLEGGFWDGVEALSDHYDIVGGAICGSFVVFGLLSVFCYPYWRRHVDRVHSIAGTDPERGDNVTEGVSSNTDCFKDPVTTVTSLTAAEFSKMGSAHVPSHYT